jgi:hypothetical protein
MARIERKDNARTIRARIARTGKPWRAVDRTDWSLSFPIHQRRIAGAIPARDRVFKAGTKAARIGDGAIRGGRGGAKPSSRGKAAALPGAQRRNADR